MIKKYLMLALVVISVFLISPTFAYDPFTDFYMRPDIRNQFNDWTESYVNGTYVLTSNRVYVDAWYIDVVLSTDAERGNNIDYYNYFAIPNFGSEYSRINVYDSAVAVNPTDRIHLEGSGETEDGYLELIGYHEFDEEYYESVEVYVSITIVLADYLDEDAREAILYDLENPEGISNSVEMTVIVGQWLYDQTYIPGGDETFEEFVERMPETEGTLEDRDLYGIGEVNLEVIDEETNYVIVDIFYSGFWEIDYYFEEGTDMSLFDSENEAYYYTDDDGKYIVINDGDESMFTMDNFNTQEFISYTVWNLETNELVTFDKFDVFLYLTLGSANHVLGYFYVDEFIIDRLVSVNSVFEYRWDPLVGEPGEWQPYATILEDTESVSGGVSWQYSLAVGSGAAAVGSLFIPVVGFPLFLVGSTISMYFTWESIENIAEGENIFIGSRDEISEVNIDSLPDVTINDINTAYQNAYGRGETMDLSTYNLYRLDYGAFQKVGSEVEINDEEGTINVIQFTYMTDGKLYTVDQESIRLNPEFDWSLDPDNDYALPPVIEDVINTDYQWIWYGVAALSVLIVNANINPKKKPSIFITLIAIAVGLLIYFGVIVL